MAPIVHKRRYSFISCGKTSQAPVARGSTGEGGERGRKKPGPVNVALFRGSRGEAGL